VALSEDQKAMLRLLAQREQGYDDLAALMGLSVEEVRAKVAEALAEVEAEGGSAPDAPAPSEPATAEPAPAASAPVPQPPIPEPAAPDSSKVPEPQETEEEPPPPPAEKPRPQAAKKASARPGAPKLSLPKDRGVQAAIGAGLLVVIVIVVLLIVGSSSGSSGSGESASSGSGGGTSVNASENQQLTGAALTPVEGGEGEGRAIFGRVKKNIVLQVEATGLKPSPKGSSYTIWLYKSPKLALRVGAVKVTDNGNIAVQLPIPTELLGYVAAGAFNQIDIALTEDAAYAAEVAKSKQEKRLPEHVGTSVLRGQITGPMIEAAAKAGK
jgi:hypothetical protein